MPREPQRLSMLLLPRLLLLLLLLLLFPTAAAAAVRAAAVAVAKSAPPKRKEEETRRRSCPSRAPSGASASVATRGVNGTTSWTRWSSRRRNRILLDTMTEGGSGRGVKWRFLPFFCFSSPHTFFPFAVSICLFAPFSASLRVSAFYARAVLLLLRFYLLYALL